MPNIELKLVGIVSEWGRRKIRWPSDKNWIAELSVCDWAWMLMFINKFEITKEGILILPFLSFPLWPKIKILPLCQLCEFYVFRRNRTAKAIDSGLNIGPTMMILITKAASMTLLLPESGATNWRYKKSFSFCTSFIKQLTISFSILHQSQANDLGMIRMTEKKKGGIGIEKKRGTPSTTRQLIVDKEMIVIQIVKRIKATAIVITKQSDVIKMKGVESVPALGIAKEATVRSNDGPDLRKVTQKCFSERRKTNV